MNAPLAYIMLSLLVLPVSGIAQVADQQFQVPAQCEGFMTIQYRSCSASHYYQCDGLEDQMIGVSVTGEGEMFMQRHDSEFRTLEQRYPSNGVILELVQPEEDPLSLTELMNEGIDTFDYFEVVNGGERLHMKGYDKLTEIEIEIDGRVMRMTEFKYIMTGPDGEVLDRISGQQFIDPDFPMLHPGIFVDEEDAEGTSNLTPVEFIFPGEEGFGSSKPKYDCEANT